MLLSGRVSLWSCHFFLLNCYIIELAETFVNQQKISGLKQIYFINPHIIAHVNKILKPKMAFSKHWVGQYCAWMLPVRMTQLRRRWRRNPRRRRCHLGKHHYENIAVHLGIAQIAIGPPPALKRALCGTYFRAKSCKCPFVHGHFS